MTKLVEPQVGDLVTYTLQDDGENFVGHGVLGPVARLCITMDERHSYVGREADAEAQEMGAYVADWTFITSATGSHLPAPAGAMGMWGSLNADSSEFPIQKANSWLMDSHTLRVRRDSMSVKIEPITKAGLAYVEANLTTDKRRDRIMEELEIVAPHLVDQLSDLLYRVRNDGKNEEALSHYDL